MTDSVLLPLLNGNEIAHLIELGGIETTLRCQVRGRVKAAPRSHKTVVFLNLDTTGPIQLAFVNADLGDETFDGAKSLRVGQAIDATVRVHHNPRNAPPVRLDVESFRKLGNAKLATRTIEVELEQAESKLKLAEIAHSAAQYLRNEGWIEAAPLTISTVADQEVVALRIVFPGLGADTMLVSSPLAQLFEISQLTMHNRLFSISRIYTRSVRDGFTSPESLAVFVVEVRTAPHELTFSRAEALVINGMAPVRGQLSQRDRESLDDKWERRPSNSIGALPEVLIPTHQVFELSTGKCFRSLWPQPIALVEGDIRRIGNSVVECHILHCERVLHLVSRVQFRRLQENPILLEGVDS